MSKSLLDILFEKYHKYINDQIKKGNEVEGIDEFIEANKEEYIIPIATQMLIDSGHSMQEALRIIEETYNNVSKVETKTNTQTFNVNYQYYIDTLLSVQDLNLNNILTRLYLINQKKMQSQGIVLMPFEEFIASKEELSHYFLVSYIIRERLLKLLAKYLKLSSIEQMFEADTFLSSIILFYLKKIALRQSKLFHDELSTLIHYDLILIAENFRIRFNDNNIASTPNFLNSIYDRVEFYEELFSKVTDNNIIEITKIVSQLKYRPLQKNSNLFIYSTTAEDVFALQLLIPDIQKIVVKAVSY